MWKAERAMMSIMRYRSLQDDRIFDILKEYMDCKDLYKICQLKTHDRTDCVNMLYNHFRTIDPIIWTEIIGLPNIPTIPIWKQFQWRCLEYRSFLQARKLIEYLEDRALWLRNFVDTNSTFKREFDRVIHENCNIYRQDASGDNFKIRQVYVELKEVNGQPSNQLQVAVTTHQERDFQYTFDFRTTDFESDGIPSTSNADFQDIVSMNSEGDNRDQAALRLAKTLHSWLHQASHIEEMTSDVNLTNLLTFNHNQPDHIDWDFAFDVTGTPNGEIGYVMVEIPIF